MKLSESVAVGISGIIAAAVIFTGCGEKAQQAVAGAERTVNVFALNHNWQQEHCRAVSIGGAILGWGTSKRNKYEFTGNQVKYIENYYSDGNCQDLAVEVTFEGNFTVGNEVQHNIREVQLTYNSGSVKVHNQSGQSGLNGTNACGISNWLIGQSVNVTGHSSDVTCLNTALPKQVFDIYSIENNVLIFGRGDDKSTPQRRPAELDRNDLFHQL